MRLRFALIPLALLALARCTNTATVNATIGLADACGSFANALDKLTPLKAAGKLDAATNRTTPAPLSVEDLRKLCRWYVAVSASELSVAVS